MTEPLAAAIAEAVRSLSTQGLAVLVRELRQGSTPARIREAVPAYAYREAVERLLAAWEGEPQVAAASVALALESVRLSRRDAPRTSLVWTGPRTSAVAVRRTDQALLQLVNRASARLIVVSFAVYRVPMVAAALRGAAARGVAVDVVVESEEASAGRVTFDGWASLGLGDGCRLWTWAHERRPRSASGRRAALHAKCAVADRRELLVSSANLTEYAHELNMELGLLVAGGELAGRVQSHFDALMASGELVRVEISGVDGAIRR